ncbi:MAG: phosphoglycerate kinase [Candidatus Bathyarchaeota archaeon]|nr:phosphoglycerate kinase [Candidatus Bathyarchaeota archaeon]
MPKKNVEDIEVKGKRVLLRVDFNVPISRNSGDISDDSRIRASLPTIKYLVDHKAKVIICSHVGRPRGEVVENLRMKPAAQRLSQLMGLPVNTTPDCIGHEVEEKVKKLKEGDILVLENLRFHPEEEENDVGFAQKLASLADIYVDDAFSTAHRDHASIVGVAKYLPAVAGFLMQKELEVMGKLLHNPERPWACLIGGAKGNDKIELLQNMLTKVDILLVGGGIAATFLKTQGYEVGNSLIDNSKLGLAKGLLQEAKELRVPFLLPIDSVVAQEVRAGASTRIVPITDIPTDHHIVDIGPKSIELFQYELGKCRTVMWNGPMGIYEMPQFAHGTKAIADFLSTLDATTIIGGGSSAEVVQEMGLADKMTHVSTGGGATLKFLEGIALAGVKVLLDKE